MATILQGKDFVSYFRRRADHDTQDAARLRFETESTISKEKENEAIVTKDGTQNVISDGENTADFTSLAYADDTETITIWEQLEEWFDDEELVEFWNVNKASIDAEGNVKATYHQGYFTSFEMTTAADGQVELSYSYAINGKGVKGTDVLDESQLDDLRNTYNYESMQATPSV